MAETPPAPRPAKPKPAPLSRVLCLGELLLLCAVAALAAFWAAKQITGHKTVVVDKPSTWLEQFRQ